MRTAPRDLSLYLYFEMYPPIAVRVWRTHASEVPYCLWCTFKPFDQEPMTAERHYQTAELGDLSTRSVLLAILPDALTWCMAAHSYALELRPSVQIMIERLRGKIDDLHRFPGQPMHSTPPPQVGQQLSLF